MFIKPATIYPTMSNLPEESHAVSTSILTACVRVLSGKANMIWTDVHMSYRGGQYSIERLLALYDFTRNTSMLSTFLVCTISSLPALLFIISQEMVPLQDPANGWKENYGFWVRAVVVTATVTYSVIVQARYFTGGFAISRIRVLLVLIFAPCIVTAITMAIAAHIWFPIPFYIITMVPIFYVVTVASLAISIERTAIRKMLKNSNKFSRFIAFIAAQQLMVVIYPAYQALFQAMITTNYEYLVILLLPVMKLLVKNIALHCLTHMEDIMPENVIFTVDFFYAFYMSTSMESSSSASTILAIILVDLAQTVTVLYRLHRRTATILKTLEECSATSTESSDLVSAASYLCSSIATLQHQSLNLIQVRSCIEYRLSLESLKILCSLEKMTRNKMANHSLKILRLRRVCCRENASIRTDLMISCNSSIDTSMTSDLPPSNCNILQETLKVLFTSECLLLGAFVDMIVPLFYGPFLLVMVRLPSAKYHIELENITAENVYSSTKPIFAFALVQCAVFLLLIALVKRNLGYNPLRHLAFVMKTQQELIQIKLLTWVLMTMTFRVVHFGAFP
ncbi:unnamed protein product [Phytophthora fragariaefolia]|uniref:Unnamed protein product n=1 Tax=Phytophthora fragariaefolia TaxID=1490495 RepID=A0A9W6XQH9_9STRA|nr:unnamed protein product [Phytophthora fragariaefolia]